MRQHKKNRPEKVTVGNVTVKIYRREKAGYEIFEVADYSRGSRRLRSYNDHDEAIAEAKKIARLMAAGEATAAQFRNSDAASYGRAREILRAAGLDTPIELVASMHVEAVQIFG